MRDRGFDTFESASRFCSRYDEQRDFFRYHREAKQPVPLAEQRRMFRQRFGALPSWLIAP